MTTASQNPRYEAHENPPLRTTLGLGSQFSLIASAALLVTPVIVAKQSGLGDGYLSWMVFASLVVVGLSTLVQVRGIGPIGVASRAAHVHGGLLHTLLHPAVADGGPATLTTLVLVCAALQLVVSKWLFILRRIVTPTLGGIVMMILSITLSSVVFHLLDETSQEEPTAAPLTALATLVVVGALMLRGTPVLRLWAPMIGIAVGCVVAAAFGIYDIDRVLQAPWIGFAAGDVGPEPRLRRHVLGAHALFPVPWRDHLHPGERESIALQRVASREARAIEFREVQGALSGAAICNLIAGAFGAVPNAAHPGIVAFTQVTGVASRMIGYSIGLMFIAVAFLPKVSGPAQHAARAGNDRVPDHGHGHPVRGRRSNGDKYRAGQAELIVAGVAFWIAAPFQFKLFTLPNVKSIWGGEILDGLLQSGITTGGIAAIVMLLFLEVTSRRGMRFESRLHADSLPELNDFINKFADRRGWNTEMKDRLNAVAEETLLTLAPLDLLADDDEEDDGRRLVVLASSDGPVADLEFIGGGDDENLEDRIRQLQQHDEETPAEQEISLRLLRQYASSVRHQQYHDADIITVRVGPPGTQ